MTMEVKKEEKNIVVKVDGWLDVNSSKDFTDEIEKLSGFENLTIDFEAVDYISSAGVRAIVAAYKKSEESNAKFKVINIKSSVLEIFKMTGLDKKMDLS